MHGPQNIISSLYILIGMQKLCAFIHSDVYNYKGHKAILLKLISAMDICLQFKWLLISLSHSAF